MALTTGQTLVAPSISRDTIAADQGYFFTASTVPGTGIIGHATSTTFVETKSIFYLYNGGNAATVYPMYLRLTMTALPVGNTQQQFTTVLDQGNRLSTAATSLTPVNQSMSSPNTSGAQINIGATVLTAATANRRIVSHRPFRPTVIGVVGDVYQFSWGSGILQDPSALATDGTARAHIMYVMAPLVIPPGNMMAIHAWGATFSTGATYEYEFGFIEK
jgi:hypothetical protein